MSSLCVQMYMVPSHFSALIERVFII